MSSNQKISGNEEKFAQVDIDLEAGEKFIKQISLDKVVEEKVSDDQLSIKK